MSATLDLTPDVDFGAAQFRRAMGKFATGVTVITFDHEGRTAGMTANAFMSLSVDPPMILVSVRAQARFAQSIACGDTFGVSFLAQHQEPLSRHFGGQPQAGLDDLFEHAGGVPVVRAALVQIAARVDAVHRGGDHLIYTADVLALRESDGPPLLFFSGRYKQIVAHDPLQCWRNCADHAD
ncbi:MULTISPECIES: flavin reductase family protein [unclassified Paraburkholderia]|uniref:flavin reductase family protein n=1 Tax=unclassified Paraburkholderia TaxID=2615204 RepID=UPI002AAFC3AD|nr:MULTISPECIES: flavin reductase family protein [unclassified Paraburkholderia]